MPGGSPWPRSSRSASTTSKAHAKHPSRGGLFTQAGVDALANVPIDELIRCLDHAVKERAAQLNPPPEDPSAPADRLLAGVQWNWETLLRNRAIDAWMHEQDIRRALNPAGGRGGLGMHVTVRSFIAALPYIVGKQAAIGPGHAVRFDITGPVAANVTIEVGSDGRASETDREPLTTISMDAETFARLAGGREPLEAFTVRVEGDEQVAASILANLAITP